MIDPRLPVTHLRAAFGLIGTRFFEVCSLHFTEQATAAGRP
ncbi:hypothetical protein [Pseudomonas chlororaphis]|nr:hypothetical protein [Pseudomonas chlororaphis]